MVMIPEKKEKPIPTPSETRLATDREVNEVAMYFMKAAKETKPSEECLQEMLSSLEDMRSFMKYGEGSREFPRATTSKYPVVVTQTSEGTRVEIAGSECLVSFEQTDKYIDWLIKDFSSMRGKTVNDIALEMWKEFMDENALPDGTIRIGKGRVSKGFMKVVREKIPKIDPDDLE